MDRCPICRLPIEHAIVLCSECGEELPLRVVAAGEGPDGKSLYTVERINESAGTATPALCNVEGQAALCCAESPDLVGN